MAVTNVYIDGLNLYHGMMDASLERYRWLDLTAFASRVCHAIGEKTDADWQVGQVRYFTSRVHEVKGAAAAKRQNEYLQALTEINPQLTIEYGKYYMREADCVCDCGGKAHVWREKRTDVNMALAVITDALDPNGPERILLITGDGDLSPVVDFAISAGKVVGVAAPPARHQPDLSNRAEAYVLLKKEHFSARNLLPREVPLDGGYVVSAPAGWMPRSMLGPS